MSELTDVASREAPRVEPARLAIPSGELRVYGADREELAGLGLCDPERWQGELPGRRVQAEGGRRVHRVTTPQGRLYLKHEVRNVPPLGRFLPRPWTSAAAANERATSRLAPLSVRTPRLLLAGERQVGSRRESFLVTAELAGRPLTAERTAGEPELVDALARFVRDLGDARVEAPDLYGKHLTFEPSLAPSLGLLNLDRVRASGRTADELLVRHLGGLVATLPGLDPRLLLERTGADDPTLLDRVEARLRRLVLRIQLQRLFEHRFRFFCLASCHQGRTQTGMGIG